MEQWEANLEQIYHLLKTLPVEGISLEQCLVTKEVGRKAPPGKAFKLTGQFWWKHNYYNNYANFAPLQSTALFIADHQKEYDFLLAEFGGDEERALEALREDTKDLDFDFEDVPSEFVGKWLVIKVGRPVSIRVKQEPIVYLQKQELRIISESGGDVQLVWDQFCADGIPGKCSIELVDYDEPELPLYTPEPLHVEKVESPIPTSTEYALYYGRVLGREWTEEERLAFMRARRLERDVFTGKRTPLSDDL